MTTDYRSWGETRNCHGCRYWSEMIAKSVGSGMQAMCLGPGSPMRSQYTSKRQTCDKWDAGYLGAVDAPEGNPYEVNQP